MNTRREFTKGALASIAAVFAASMPVGAVTSAFDTLREKPLRIGVLIFERMDQIDFTGPFSVLSRLPEASLAVLSKDGRPIRDHKGLRLTPDLALDDADSYDVLQIPGGPGQEALMDDEAVLSLIRRQMESQRVLFSVCTGALICGAAGVLRGRKATTHWSAVDLLPLFGATPVRSRVVVDGPLITAAGVTAGIDGALTLAALLRGEAVAQQIQLDIQYAPDPPFHSGEPQTAPRDVLDAVQGRYEPLTNARRATAKRIATKLGV
jgi:cyclohexyl-isocyanide hydratase